MRPTRPYRTPRPRRLIVVLVPAMAAAMLVACSRGPDPEPALRAFLDGWRGGKLDAVGFVTPEGAAVPAATVAGEIASLSGDLAEVEPALKVGRKPEVSEDLATAEIAVSWPVAQGVTWDYASPVRLAEEDGTWKVVWTPAVVHPKLTSGDKLAVRRTAAPRATILDGAGEPVVKPRPVVVVGVSPQRIENFSEMTGELDAAFRSIGQPVDLSGLKAKVDAAKPDAFIELIVLRRPLYDKIRWRIQPLEGTVFREENRQLAPTREFARLLLGTVGEVTQEIMEARPGVYRVGDSVGLSGLQRQYDDRLRGTPSVSVLLARTDAEGEVDETELWKSEPRPGTPLRTTLDPNVQIAADEALAGESKRSAIAAVRVSDGAVLAVANGPDGGDVNLALTAEVPPGSTFKMVTALGLLDGGHVTLDTPVPCPRTFTVDGRSFRNSEGFALGTVPFRRDFARSCNTAFAALAPNLGPDGLAEAGRAVGIGVPWDLGVDATSGEVSAGGSAAERAAAAFGQGTTVVSPIALAAAAAGIGRGRWQQPTLLLDPAPARPAAPGPQLKASTVEPLRTMMREVVTGGTGQALAKVPGGPVYGKTGTAEYDDNPAHTHAWFVGWQGDVAFAVFVERGGDSSDTSVPLAAEFLRNLAR
jgi:cell division protein FtsI/penicillin-binding protein 2